MSSTTRYTNISNTSSSRYGPEHRKTAITKCTQGWKPTTLKAPFLVTLIAFCSVVIGILEWLSWKSERDGFVAFTSSDNFAPSTTFIFLYLPTIIAVSFSMIWSWVDLDVKRLEPFYQLSKDNGAMAQKSILLQYPVDFIAFVPFKAAKHR